LGGGFDVHGYRMADFRGSAAARGVLGKTPPL
jgi:hypothetical protein